MKKLFVFTLFLTLSATRAADYEYAQQVTRGLTKAEFWNGGDGTLITLTGSDKTVCLTINAARDNCSIKQNGSYRPLPLYQFVLILRACKLEENQSDITSLANGATNKIPTNDKDQFNAALEALNL